LLLLFFQMLLGLHKFKSMEKYQYVGFGSYMFDDFKILHNNLGMADMISLESDADVCKRAEFNKPYQCITVLHTKSSDYIAQVFLEQPCIFWLDYTAPRDFGEQFSDFCTIISKMNSGDIIRITLNAEPSSLLGRQIERETPLEDLYKKRYKVLRDRIEPYIPSDVNENCMTSKKYPLALLRCLMTAAMQTLPPYPLQTKELFPLFSSVYADGQQMVTLTAIVVNGNDIRQNIQECLLQHENYINFKWDEPCPINVPSLTPKEIIYINNFLPIKNSTDEIKRNFDFIFQGEAEAGDPLSSYVNYYKYYPNFHHVNF